MYASLGLNQLTTRGAQYHWLSTLDLVIALASNIIVWGLPGFSRSLIRQKLIHIWHMVPV